MSVRGRKQWERLTENYTQNRISKHNNDQVPYLKVKLLKFRIVSHLENGFKWIEVLNWNNEVIWIYWLNKWAAVHYFSAVVYNETATCSIWCHKTYRRFAYLALTIEHMSSWHFNCNSDGQETEQAGWSGNTPDLYLCSYRFETRPGHRLPPLTFLLFLSLFRQMYLS
jgi:hypothetical protein